MSESAVVTAVADAGSRDRLLTFFTRGRGGLRLYAKRPPRRATLTRFIEPLQGGELLFTVSGEGNRPRLHSFIPQRVWPGIRTDLGRSLHAIAFFETLSIFLAEEQSSPALFTLLVGYLDQLEGERRPGLARIVATLRLLELNGLAPHVASCVACRNPSGSGTGALFSFEGGGILCRGCCAGRREQTTPVSPGALRFMQRALSREQRRAGLLRVASGIEWELLRLIDRYVEAQTGTAPRAGAAIERIETH